MITNIIYYSLFECKFLIFFNNLKFSLKIAIIILYFVLPILKIFPLKKKLIFILNSIIIYKFYIKIQ